MCRNQSSQLYLLAEFPLLLLQIHKQCILHAWSRLPFLLLLYLLSTQTNGRLFLSFHGILYTHANVDLHRCSRLHCNCVLKAEPLATLVSVTSQLSHTEVSVPSCVHVASLFENVVVEAMMLCRCISSIHFDCIQSVTWNQNGSIIYNLGALSFL